MMEIFIIFEILYTCSHLINNDMFLPFSLRHKATLASGQIDIILTEKFLLRLYHTLENYNTKSYDSDENGLIYNWEFFIYKITPQLIKLYGVWSLFKIVDGEKKNIKGLYDFLIYSKPEQIFDLIELFYPENLESDYQKEINNLFITEDLPWRMLDDSIIKLDSSFAESEILAKSIAFLSANGFNKGFHDFKLAILKLSVNDYPGCIVDANNALESVLKKITGQHNAIQGPLIKHIRKLNLIPPYFQGFTEHFDNFLQDVFTIANSSARHGMAEMPHETRVVTKEIAAFTLNLVGTLLIFLVERYATYQKGETN